MIGGLIFGIVQTFTGFFISVEMKDVVALIIFILILLVRPQGLLGTKGAEELGTK